MVKGVFIVVDGMDGSGKSEMVKLLHNYIFSKNKKYYRIYIDISYKIKIKFKKWR